MKPSPGFFKPQEMDTRCAGITRARATQIMNLLHLAPEIQEALLFLPRTTAGRAPVTEGDLREVVAQPDWTEQRRLWRAVGRGNRKASTAALHETARSNRLEPCQRH